MISICITTYNGEKYIKAQLDSIIPQISAEDEIIISDDGSTDKTLQIIENIGDKRIKVFHHKNDNTFPDFSFYKITKNFENALQNAIGDIIFLSDQDDIWLPNKVNTVKLKIKDNWLLLHDCVIINENKGVIENSYFYKNNSKSGLINNIINSSYLGCCMTLKRELLAISLPFPENPVPHDVWIGLIAESKKKVIFIEDKLVLYRRHENNMSTSGEQSGFSLKMKLTYRYILVKEFLKKYWNFKFAE